MLRIKRLAKGHLFVGLVSKLFAVMYESIAGTYFIIELRKKSYLVHFMFVTLHFLKGTNLKWLICICRGRKALLACKPG